MPDPNTPNAGSDHILEHGFVTTEELTSVYGYEHAPRAARDVREEVIPLETFRVKSTSGRTIGAYHFGDLSSIRRDRIGGRVAFSKGFKSCNRAKSWSCEHCGNWLVEKKPSICASCYWASPQDYKHIAMHTSRRLEVVWTEGETELYDRLKAQSQLAGEPLPDFVKQILREHLDEEATL